MRVRAPPPAPQIPSLTSTFPQRQDRWSALGPCKGRQGVGAGLLQPDGERLQLVGEQVPVHVQGDAGIPVTAVSLPARGRPPQAAARRAGLEGVEKSLPVPSPARTGGSGTPTCFATPVPTRRASWVAQAACRGKPTAWWFPAPSDELAVRVVVLICRRYPVRAECLEEALLVETGGYVFGVRGGGTAGERRTLLR
jgi:Transcription factor WhiB